MRVYKQKVEVQLTLTFWPQWTEQISPDILNTRAWWSNKPGPVPWGPVTFWPADSESHGTGHQSHCHVSYSSSKQTQHSRHCCKWSWGFIYLSIKVSFWPTSANHTFHIFSCLTGVQPKYILIDTGGSRQVTAVTTDGRVIVSVLKRTQEQCRCCRNILENYFSHIPFF